MYLCADCNEPIEREEIEYYNGQPMHMSCKIANIINDGCSFEDAISELERIGYDKKEAIHLLKTHYNW